MNRVDRKRLQENIWYYGKLKGLKIGDIERYIGRTLGIVSRWATKQIDNISLDDVYNIAILLDVTIDELINTNVGEIKRQQEILELKKQQEEITQKLKKYQKEITLKIQELEGKE